MPKHPAKTRKMKTPPAGVQAFLNAPQLKTQPTIAFGFAQGPRGTALEGASAAPNLPAPSSKGLPSGVQEPKPGIGSKTLQASVPSIGGAASDMRPAGVDKGYDVLP